MPASWIKNPPQQPLMVTAQAAYYPGMVQVYIPNMPLFRRPLVDPKELTRYDEEERPGSPDTAVDVEGSAKETVEERAVRRAKKRINDYILCNEFDIFATLTFAVDRDKPDKNRQQLLDWLKNQRNRNGRFKYVFVQEYHKDRTAIHFHGVLAGYAGKITPAMNEGRPVIQNGKQVYNLTGYTLGFTNAKLIGKTLEDRTRSASYLQKYITKDFQVKKGQHRYLASKNLSLPKIEDNPQEWYKFVQPSWQKKTANGRILRFERGASPLSDMYLEAYGDES